MGDEWDDLSGHQLKGLIQCALLEHRTLTKPSAVEPVIVTACAALVVDVLCDGIEHAPCRAFSRSHLSAQSLPFI